jgi:hypothetical protein
MQTFIEWLEEKEPGLLSEMKRREFLGKALGAVGAAGAMGLPFAAGAAEREAGTEQRKTDIRYEVDEKVSNNLRGMVEVQGGNIIRGVGKFQLTGKSLKGLEGIKVVRDRIERGPKNQWERGLYPNWDIEKAPTIEDYIKQQQEEGQKLVNAQMANQIRRQFYDYVKKQGIPSKAWVIPKNRVLDYKEQELINREYFIPYLQELHWEKLGKEHQVPTGDPNNKISRST